jgi:hypothetical protein
MAARVAAQATGTPTYVERDSIRVIYQGNARAAAERTLEAALAPLPLPGIPEAAVLPRSSIFLAPDQAAFDSAALGRPPSWAAAVAIPSQRMIVLPAFGRDAFSDPVITLRHELAHLALNGYVQGGVPRWFDEGYATWVSGGWDERSGWQIRLALLTGQAPVLDSLALGWPRGEPRARLAYLLSASAVRHLATSRGDPAFEAFLDEWRRTGSFDGAFRSTYQMTLSQFEREWRGMVRRRYGWLLAITQATILWVGAAVLVFVLGILRRRRNRERLEALRREEYMLPPAVEGEDYMSSEESNPDPDLDADSDPARTRHVDRPEGSGPQD